MGQVHGKKGVPRWGRYPPFCFAFLYWSYYPHMSRDSLSPVCGIFTVTPMSECRFFQIWKRVKRESLPVDNAFCKGRGMGVGVVGSLVRLINSYVG